MKKTLLALDNVMIKNFSGIGFQRFSMEIHHGEVYGIICDSIEERNLIASLFSGHCEMSAGIICYNGKRVLVQELVRIFHTDFTVIGVETKLIGSIPIAENICLKKQFGWVHQRTCEMKARTYLERFGLKLEINIFPEQLDAKERVEVELIRGFVEGKKLIVLKDLSTFLNDAELAEIHRVMQQMSNTTFVLVEPFGQLVFDWSNKLLVTRGWQVNGCFDTDLVEKEKLLRYLSVSKSAGNAEYKYEGEDPDEILSFEEVTTQELVEVTFRVRKGEILNICCLDEESMTGIRNLICGKYKLVSGKMIYLNKELHYRNANQVRNKGIAYIQATPSVSMLLSNMSVRDNFMIDLSKKMPFIWLKLRFRKNVDMKLDEMVQEGIGKYKVSELSSVLKQKLVYAKILSTAPKVVICERPFFDVDLHMQEVTLKAIKELQQRNIAVIVLLRNTRDIELLEGNVLYLRNGEMV